MGSGLALAPLKNAGSWQSGLLRRPYNSVDVSASRGSKSLRPRQNKPTITMALTSARYPGTAFAVDIPTPVVNFRTILNHGGISKNLKMGTWSLVRLSLEHCSGALLIGAIFSVTTYLYGVMFPDSAALWWIGKVDLALVILVTTALGIIFVNSLARIVYNTIVSIWKGGSDVNAQVVLA